MHTKTLAWIFMSLLTPAIRGAKIGKRTEADLVTHTVPLGARDESYDNEAWNWCQQEQDGVALWRPSDPLNDSTASMYHRYDDTSRRQPRSTVEMDDVRESLIIGGPSGKKESSPLLQARLAVMAAWANTDAGRIESNFRNVTNGGFPWCLPGKDMLSIQPERKNDSINGMTQKGDDLRNLVHSARAQVAAKLAATWPWFLNRAYLKCDIKDDAASNPQDNPWGRGEEHAVKFLSALTGRDCQIDGGFEANNTLVNSFLYKSWRSPMIAILPDETDEKTGYLKGFYAIREAEGNTSDGTGRMRLWDHNKGEYRMVNLPTRMKIVHRTDEKPTDSSCIAWC